jgi:hypothetical protein
MLKQAFYTPNFSLCHPKDGEVIRGERRQHCKQNHSPKSSAAGTTAEGDLDGKLGEALGGELRTPVA